MEVDITNRPECDILSLSPGEKSDRYGYLRLLVQLQAGAVSQMDTGETGHSNRVWQGKFANELPINILGKYG